RLAHGAQCLGTVWLEHGPALDEDRRDDLVAGRHVGHDLVDQVACRRARGVLIPQVMMRVADGQIGLERGLDGLREPVVVLRACRHGGPLPAPRAVATAGTRARPGCATGAPTANAGGRVTRSPDRVAGTYNPSSAPSGAQPDAQRRPTMAVETSREPIRPVTG